MESTTKSEEYSRTFTSFSGADYIAVLNNKVIGEFQGYNFKETLGVILDENGDRTSKRKFIGVMQICVFDCEPVFREILKPEGNEFTLFFGNEYGQRGVIEFENIEFTERHGGVAIDDIVMTERYIYKCDNHLMSKKDWVYDPYHEKPYRIVSEEERARYDQLDDLVRKEVISRKISLHVNKEMNKTGETPIEVIERLGLRTLADNCPIEKHLAEMKKENGS